MHLEILLAQPRKVFDLSHVMIFCRQKGWDTQDLGFSGFYGLKLRSGVSGWWNSQRIKAQTSIKARQSPMNPAQNEKNISLHRTGYGMLNRSLLPFLSHVTKTFVAKPNYSLRWPRTSCELVTPDEYIVVKMTTKNWKTADHQLDTNLKSSGIETTPGTLHKDFIKNLALWVVQLKCCTAIYEPFLKSWRIIWAVIVAKTAAISWAIIFGTSNRNGNTSVIVIANVTAGFAWTLLIRMTTQSEWR